MILAENGQVALNKLTAGLVVDGVLMDCQMPVMDGYTATEKIRALPEFDKLPILAMTANVMAGDRERALNCGMNDLIGKPIDVGELFGTLGKWLKPVKRETSQPVLVESVPPTDIELEVEGLDKIRGMETVQQDKALYLDLLRRFSSYQGAFNTRFSAAWEQGDRKTAEREAHTLRGSAGTLGAKDIARLAGELERAVRDQSDNDVPNLAEQVCDQLVAMLSSLNRQLESTEQVEEPISVLTNRELGEELDKLSLLLDDFDSEALTAMSALMGR